MPPVKTSVKQKLFNQGGSLKKNRARLAIKKRWEIKKQQDLESISSSRPTSEVSSSSPTSIVSDSPSRPNPTISLEVNPIPGPSRPTIPCPNEPSRESMSTDDLYTNVRKKDFIASDIKVGLEDLCAAPEYLLVDKKSLSSLFTSLVCPNCFMSCLKLSITSKVGFKAHLSVECTNCVSDDLVSVSSSTQTQSNEYDINRRVVKAFSTISKGYAAIEQFALVMNMDIMSKGLYNKCMTNVNKATKMAGIASLTQARARVRKHCIEEDTTLDVNSVIDLSVSFDGSWHKRGFTSNYGVGSIIHLDTGLVIDYCVLSKFCRNCALAEHDLGVNSPEFETWYHGHAIDCDKNYDGSSPGMEVAAAEILWKRSLNYKFRYVTVVSDGDSKVFTHLKELNVYGEHVDLQKEECINHVSKRLGTALRNQVKVCKAQKITLGGKAHGSLKDSTIKKLTRYYHNAVFSNINKDVKSVRRSILATLHHCISTDERPHHSKCPTDKNSWCFYNRAVANEETPGSHADNVKTPLNPTVLEHIAPIYKRLTETHLLERCLKGQTQNANESLHSFIWRKCDKARSVSRRLVESAVAEGVSEYNFGNVSAIYNLQQAKISPGGKSVAIARARDRRRKIKICQAKSERVKRRRNYLKMKNLKDEENKKEQEGSMYGAGEF